MESPDAILEFWFGDDPADAVKTGEAKASLWWGGPQNDDLIRERFGGLREQAVRGELPEWEGAPRGRLALIILVDQFSRSIFRGTPQAFAQDHLALRWCLEGLDQDVDAQLRPLERVFFYLPLEHSESLPHQERCVQLYTQLRDAASPAERRLFENYLDFGRRHHDIIRRFSRFPHRNAILGRESTPAEVEFLKQPGSSF